MDTGHQTDFDPKAFGPFGAFYQAYFSALENIGRAYGVPSPVATDFAPNAMSQRLGAPFKAAARTQLEVLGLVNRRTQAYLHVPTLLARCRTPQDLVNAQMAFWRTAGEQYTDAARKVFDAWTSQDAWSYSNGRPAATARDYINFNGTGSKERGSHAGPEQPTGKQRRVA
ncbi:phasin family protein [Hyphomicrobium sp.]|uniref:phasin family protein n=1 Tax=Hyphomicrobium sp. TaxID=82 RepID=UPI0025BED649|nr:phasin family protein [Hyphomicrobium sp.]MCC7254088.1 phasin family protein [Hyphomicrobium sp.]